MANFLNSEEILKSDIKSIMQVSENPHNLVEEIIFEIQKAIEDTSNILDEAIFSEKQARYQLEQVHKSSFSWEAKAKTALNLGNKDLVKRAFSKKITVDTNIKHFEELYGSMSQKILETKKNYKLLIEKLDEAIDFRSKM